MDKIEINVQDELGKLLPKTLIKELRGNEAICPNCNGLGIIKRKQRYGLTNENSNNIDWHSNEYFGFCTECYSGVIKLCQFCGKKLHYSKCDCKEFRILDEKETRQKYLENQDKRIEKAIEIDVATEIYDYLYDDNADKYYAEIEEFVEDNIDIPFEDLPKVLWKCDSTEVSLDAGRIVELACEDLHEDVYDNCNIDELQKLLDDWCKKQDGATTYFPKYKKYVKVKKEWFEE